MLSIDRFCNDTVAKHYAAIFTDNAAIPLKVGGFGIIGLETPSRKLVLYNVFREDTYRSLIEDELVPHSLKSRVLEQAQVPGQDFQPERIRGWHILRTENALQGEALRDFLTSLKKTLDLRVYSKSKGKIVRMATCLIDEKVYAPRKNTPTSDINVSEQLMIEENGPVSRKEIGDAYKVFIEVKDSLDKYCQQLFDLGQTYGAIANPILTDSNLAVGQTKADYYVIGRDADTDAKSRATALGKALERLDFVKMVHVQNFNRRN